METQNRLRGFTFTGKVCYSNRTGFLSGCIGQKSADVGGSIQKLSTLSVNLASLMKASCCEAERKTITIGLESSDSSRTLWPTELFLTMSLAGFQR